MHHHFGRPRLGFQVAVVEAVDATVSKFACIVTLGTRHFLRLIVLFKSHYICHVLHNRLCFGRCPGLTRIVSRVKAHVIRQAGSMGYIAQLGSINQIVGAYQLFFFIVYNYKLPSA